MSRNMSVEDVSAPFLASKHSSDTFLPQRQAAQEAQDRELDERRLQGIAVVMFYNSPQLRCTHSRASPG